MTPKETIKRYLQGARAYEEGVQLYARHGTNPILKQNFARLPQSPLLQATLTEELRKLAGLTETELRRMKRCAVTRETCGNIAESAAETCGNNFAAANGKPPAGAPKPAPVKAVRTIKFRERFPFLSKPDCPDVLKVVTNDLFTDLDKYREARRRLMDSGDDISGNKVSVDKVSENRAELCASVVEHLLRNQAAWKELEHYNGNRRLAGIHPAAARYLKQTECTRLSDIDLVVYRKNAASNVSKWKRKLGAATGTDERRNASESLQEWEDRRDAAERELNIRKKKQ